MNKKFEKFDERVIYFFRKNGHTISRLALFIIFFWFGILKPLGLSPAGPLVIELLENTFLNFLTPEKFLAGFGIFEVIIGIMILIPKLERITFALLAIHLFTTVLPLFVIPDVAWYGLFSPTLIGQYIIKNTALLSLGIILFANLKPMTKTHSVWGKY